MPEQMTLEQLVSNYSLQAIAPEVSLAISALVVLLAGVFIGESLQRRVLPVLAILGVAVSFGMAVNIWGQNLLFGSQATAVYAADNFALFFKFILLAGLLLTICISGRLLAPREGDEHSVSGEYYTLLMLATVGMMMVASARDLLIVFLGIETFSIALYILAGFSRRQWQSNEAALKYLLLGGFASGFLLYGIALVYFATGSTLFPEIAKAISGGLASGPVLGSSSTPVFYAGIALILIGLGFKASAVPFHQWTPDVYEGAPTPVTAFMATGAKAAAFAAILRVFPGAFGHDVVSAQWHHLVLVLAVLTMTVGNVIALSQSGLKRMLAYSSIAHAGYLLVGVVTCGAAVRNSGLAGMEDAVARSYAGVLFYLLIYTVMTIGAFAVVVHLENQRNQEVSNKENSNLQVHELKGLASRSPLMAAMLTLFLLSLAGIPPTAGFFGKFSIFLEAMHQGLIGLLIVSVLNSVISVYYYFSPIVAMYSAEESAVAADATAIAVQDGQAVAVRSGGLSLGIVLAVAICAIGILGMIAFQSMIFPLVLEAVPV